MPQKNIGRKQACPCGSGEKYKRCCLPIHDAAREAQARAAAHVHGSMAAMAASLDAIDALYNRTSDLIRSGRLDEAELACQQLAERAPDEIDHLDQLAHLREAQGRYAEAAVLYRQAAGWARVFEGFDDAIIEQHAAGAVRCQQRAAKP